MVEVRCQPLPHRLENTVFGLHLAEYHTGYRAYTREALEAVNLEMNSDNFIFDQEIMAQFVDRGLTITQVPVPTRYFAEASSASFWQSSVYGIAILRVLYSFACTHQELPNSAGSTASPAVTDQFRPLAHQRDESGLASMQDRSVRTE